MKTTFDPTIVYATIAIFVLFIVGVGGIIAGVETIYKFLAACGWPCGV